MLKNTGDEIAGATGFVLSRSSVFIHFGGPQGHGDSVEDAVRMAGEHRRQKIAGATGFVLSRSSVFIAFGGPPRAMERSLPVAAPNYFERTDFFSRSS